MVYSGDFGINSSSDHWKSFQIILKTMIVLVQIIHTFQSNLLDLFCIYLPVENWSLFWWWLQLLLW